jgi:hypothetical protein
MRSMTLSMGRSGAADIGQNCMGVMRGRLRLPAAVV